MRSGVELGPVDVIDAAASVVGAELWCAVNDKASLAHQGGVSADVSCVAAALLLRAAGAGARAFPHGSGMIVAGPGFGRGLRLMALTAAADRAASWVEAWGVDPGEVARRVVWDFACGDQVVYTLIDAVLDSWDAPA